MARAFFISGASPSSFLWFASYSSAILRGVLPRKISPALSPGRPLSVITRIEPSETLEYNYLSDGLLRKILIEMFGNATVGDRNAFYERYVESVDENGVCKVGATGDFGDAGYFFFKPDQKARMDGDRLMVTGEIMVYQPEDGNYAPDMSFTAWFTPNDDDAVWGWCFDELRIGGAYA